MKYIVEANNRNVTARLEELRIPAPSSSAFIKELSVQIKRFLNSNGLLIVRDKDNDEIEVTCHQPWNPNGGIIFQKPPDGN